MKINLKKLEENFFRAIMILSTMLVLLCLVIIIGVIIKKGAGAMNLDMIIKTPQGGYYLGKEGGILNAIIGSLFISVGATFASILISLPVAIYLNVYADKSSKMVHLTRMSLEFLWGIPSIVYGAFGFIVMIFFGIRASMLGGIITVALLIFPIMSRSIDEIMQMLPDELLEASYALGATKLETALRVVIRQSFPGIISAVLIAYGRGIGDAASVLFTSGFSDRIPLSLLEPAATLPLAIFFQLGTPYPEVQERAYASAFILTVIILAISVISRLLTARFRKHTIT